MKIENILVVGANGFVGYYLVKRLLQCKYMVIGLDCNDDNISEFLEKDNYMFIKMNLFEEDFFDIKIKIDVIVNLAAIGHGTLLSKKNEVIFVVKLASGIAALVVSICLSVCRLSSNTDVVTDAVAGGSVVGLRMTMTVIPVIGLLIAVFYFHRKYILTEQKMEEISERIKESH